MDRGLYTSGYILEKKRLGPKTTYALYQAAKPRDTMYQSLEYCGQEEREKQTS